MARLFSAAFSSQGALAKNSVAVSRNKSALHAVVRFVAYWVARAVCTSMTLETQSHTLFSSRHLARCRARVRPARSRRRYHRRQQERRRHHRRQHGRGTPPIHIFRLSAPLITFFSWLSSSDNARRTPLQILRQTLLLSATPFSVRRHLVIPS